MKKLLYLILLIPTLCYAGITYPPPSDTVYGASWDGVVGIAPSKNAVYDKIETTGDITSVGDCTTGACFDGTQGTTLTFNNATGDQTISYNNLTKDFHFSDDITVYQVTPKTVLWDSDDDTSWTWHYDTAAASAPYQGLTLWHGSSGDVGDGLPELHIDANNKWNFDQNTLYIDAVNNNVGIGTASPAAALHIVGEYPEITIEGAESTFIFTYEGFTYDSINDDGICNFIASSGDSFRFKLGDASGVETLSIYDNSFMPENEVASIDSDGNAQFDGNVGIGTTSPATALQVAPATGITIGEDKTTPTVNVAGLLKLISVGDNAFYTTFITGTQTANADYTLPTALPASNKVLQSTSTGVLTWETAAGGAPGGSDTQVQFNDAGAFGGDAGFVYNKTTDTVTLLGGLIAPIQDADGNTKIQTEESANEDIIRFDIAGIEQIRLEDGKLIPTVDSDIDLGRAYSSGLDQSNILGTLDAGWGSTIYRGQTFTTGASITSIYSVSIYSKYNTGTQDTVTVDIYAVDVNHKPTGASLGSKTISSYANASYEWKEFVFASLITISSNTEYAMVVNSSGSSSTATYHWSCANNTNPYANGGYLESTNSGATWGWYDGYDLQFKTFYGPVVSALQFKNLCSKNLYSENLYFDALGMSTVDIANNFKIQGGYLAIGNAGTINFADGDGDLYVEDELEVDGDIRLDAGGTIYMNWMQGGIRGLNFLYFDVAGTSRYIQLSDNNIIVFGAGGDVNLQWNDTGNDHFAIGIVTGSAGSSGNIIISEKADINTNWGFAASTDPRLYIQSADATSVNDYISFWHDQTDGNIQVGAGDMILTPPAGEAVKIVNGLVIPSGTTPSPADEGALFLDTDASANGTLVMYSNGVWRTVAAW